MIFVRLIILIIWASYAWSMGQIPESGLNPLGKFIALSFFAVAPLLYLLPTIEAYIRRQQNLTSITLVNIFLGWTLVGWVVALAWACKNTQSETQTSTQPPAANSPIPIRKRETTKADKSTNISVADELQKLANLKQKGILTDDEFESQKAKLLS